VRLAEAPAAFGPPTGYVRLPDADEEDEQFLSEFSWGSGCTFYYFSRALILLFLGLCGVSFVIAVFGFLVGDYDLDTEKLKPLSITGLLSLIATLAFMAYVGRSARQRRWQRLQWQDFEQFRRNETSWRTVGIIGWALSFAYLLKDFILGE
jgi:hypothetical protein